MGNTNHLGDYLRTRRGRSRRRGGTGAGPRRRIAGLRRDELALLAGISSEYLQRLEQGRDRHPSTEVLNSIARALRIDTKATAYLSKRTALAADRCYQSH
jgi:transcriptional regulator with XRE-family HTH domain